MPATLIGKPVSPLLQSGDLATGILLGFPMTDGNGTTVRDASGRGNKGTLGSSVTWVDGPFGRCLNLPGTGTVASQVNITALRGASALATSVTLATWVRVDTIVANAPFIETRAGGQLIGLLISGATEHGITGSWNAAAGEFNAALGLTITASEWTFAAMTVSGALMTVYRGSVSKGFGVATLAITASAKDLSGAWFMGYDATSAHYMAGAQDAVVIYNRALSSADIAAMYADSFQIYREEPWMLMSAVSKLLLKRRRMTIGGLAG